MNKEKLLRHVFGTYFWLRGGMIGIAIVFPVLLLGVGWLWYGLPLQGSMSAYYWASIDGDPPMRVWFVGCIFAIGSCLILYKGYTDAEDWALNLAGVLVILVALFPMSWKCGTELGYCGIWRWHSVFAFAFFACIVYVALFQSRKTLNEFHNEAREKHYKRAYWVTSAVLGASPVAAIVAHLLTQRYQALTYWIEACAIWAFAAFWIVKSWELHQSQAEEKVLESAVDSVNAD